MTAGRFDIIFEPTTTWDRTLLWRDAAGVVVNTTGYQALLQIRKQVTDPVPVLEASTANGMISVGILGTSPNQTNIRWAVPPSVTSLVADFGKGVWALKMTDASGRVTRLIEGFCYYSPEAAHP